MATKMTSFILQTAGLRLLLRLLQRGNARCQKGKAKESVLPAEAEAKKRKLCVAPGPRATDIEKRIWSARVDLAAAYRILDKFFLNEGICNHLTMLVPGTRDRFLCIAYGTAWSEVTASNLLLLDTDGNIIEGEGECESTAFFIHKAIHLADPDKNVCCLHTHQPNASAICCVGGGRLEMCHQNCLRFYEEIAYDPQFNGLVLGPEEGERLVKAMGSNRILFHANHGVIVNGTCAAAAVDDIYYLERACEVQLKAMSMGKPLEIIGKKVAEDFKADLDAGGAVWAEKHFAALKRQLRIDARVEGRDEYDS